MFIPLFTIGKSFLEQVAQSLGLTALDYMIAGTILSLVFTGIFIILTLTVKNPNPTTSLVVGLLGVLAFTAAGWIDVIYGAILAFIFAIMIAEFASRQGKVGGT